MDCLTNSVCKNINKGVNSMANNLQINELIKSGKKARLMPALVNSKTEERATSCLLASFMVVPAFAMSVLSGIGAPTGKRFRVECFTEVVFETNGKDEGKIPRPDGLIVATNGSTTWTALIESKVGSSELENEQVERYLDLAKANGINTVITISNQYVLNPQHHPLQIPKNKLRSTQLFHFSWHYLLSRAVLVSHDREMDDPEQSFILDDLINFLDHPASGVSAFTSMHEDWKNVCQLVQQHTPLTKNSKPVANAVTSWQQLLRASAIKLSRVVREPVEVNLSSAQKKAPEQFAKDMLENLVKSNTLDSEFTVPNAAAKIRLVADLSRRNISISMNLDAPKDVSRTTAAINWLTRQLKSIDCNGVSIRAHWPKRIPMTSEALAAVLERPEVLIPPGVKDLPRSLEVVKVTDLAAKFKSRKTIVEDTGKHFLLFYEQVGQHLSKWIPKAPKVKTTPKSSSEGIQEQNEPLTVDTTTPLEPRTSDVKVVNVEQSEPLNESI